MGGQQKIPSQREGWKGYFRQAAPSSRLRGSWNEQLPPTVDRLDLAEGYSSGRSQVRFRGVAFDMAGQFLGESGA